jgi:hypothetical protein
MTDIANLYGIEKVPCETTLLVITMTVGVTNYFCEDHSEQAHDSAIDQIMQTISTDSEITVLGYSAKPLTLTEIKA